MASHGDSYDGLHNGLHAVRDKKTGSLFQRCEARYGCPPITDGKRPPHKCQARWFGSVEAGFTADGTRRRITVSGKSKAVVSRRLRDKRLEVEQAGAANTRRAITVAKWAEVWMSELETQIRPTSLTTDQAAAKWIIKTIGHVKLSELTPAHVRSVAKAIRSAGLSSSTALRYHGPLIRMLKAAAVEGYNIPPNVLLGKKPTAAVNDRQAIPLEDALKILKHINARDDDGRLLTPDASRWSLAFLQGIRHGEAHGLTWPMVDLENGLLTICWQVQSITKGKPLPDGYEAVPVAGTTHLVRPKSSAGWRVMPLVPWAVDALREWRALAPENPHQLVWPGRQTRAATWPRNKASDRAAFAKIQAEVGVAHPSGRRYHPHEIRNTTATLLMEGKISESVRIAIMGHSTIKSTRSYEFVDPAQTLAALQGVGTMLELGK
jgi:integrase